MYKFDDYHVEEVFNILKAINPHWPWNNKEDFLAFLQFHTWSNLQDRCGYWGTGGFYVTTYLPQGHKAGDMPGVHLSIQPFTVRKYIESQQNKMDEIRNLIAEINGQ